MLHIVLNKNPRSSVTLATPLWRVRVDAAAARGPFKGPGPPNSSPPKSTGLIQNKITVLPYGVASFRYFSEHIAGNSRSKIFPSKMLLCMYAWYHTVHALLRISEFFNITPHTSNERRAPPHRRSKGILRTIPSHTPFQRGSGITTPRPGVICSWL